MLGHTQPELRIGPEHIVLIEGSGRGWVLDRTGVVRVRRLTLMTARHGTLPASLLLDAGERCLLRLPAEYDGEAVAAALGVPVDGDPAEVMGWRTARRLHPGALPRGDALAYWLAVALVAGSIALFATVTGGHLLGLRP